MPRTGDRRRLGWALAATAAAVSSAVAVGALLAWSWGQDLRAEERLLPGVTVAGVDVGGLDADTALDAVREATDPALDRELRAVLDDRAWRTTPRDLDADTDAQAVLSAALDATDAASLTDLVAYRWLGRTSELDLDVELALPTAPTNAFVDAIAAVVDEDPVDAAYRWADATVVVDDGRTGLRVDRAATVARLQAAAAAGAGTVEVAAQVLSPDLTTEHAQHALADVRAAVDATLDRTVVLTHDGTTWEMSARQLGAVPDLGPATATVTAGAEGPGVATPAGLEPADPPVPLDLPEGQLADYVDELAGAVDVPARSATIAWNGSELVVTPERSGLALDRDAAAARLAAALDGGADRIELPVDTVQPAVTSAAYHRVLLVRQDLRRLELREGGEVVRDWPVAVGQGGSPTPTGVFTVGARRHLPTWYNPSPDGWGSDMPAVVGPGPDNPLGVRALNWNRSGADTLIRFHGTPNEASIGQAASRGCVRLTNDDVIELFDLAPTGTVIVSVTG